MNLLLDTHAWFWLLEEPERLPDRVRTLLSDPDVYPVGLAAISLWEFAKLVEKGRIALAVGLREWVRQATDPSYVEIIPLDPDIAIESTMLPGDFHSDPADQLIVASARMRNATLLTADQQIQAYPHVRTIWE